MKVCGPTSTMTIACGFTLLLAAVSYGQGAQVTVGPNVQVSKARERQVHEEVILAADPKDPNRLIGASIVFPENENREYTIVYSSFDGGKSWTPTLETGSLFGSALDPACAYGADGTAYFATAVSTGPYTRWTSLAFFRSADGGKTWAPPTLLPFMDREFVVIDASGGTHDGRVYLNGKTDVESLRPGGRAESAIGVFRSDDGGITFQGPVQSIASRPSYVVPNSNCVVLSDGTLVCLFGEVKDYWREDGSNEIPENKPGRSNARLKVISSADGGESFTPGTISDFYLDYGAITASVPYLAADPASRQFKDRLYAVWPDRRSGRLEIFLSYSADKGKTWSRPIVVNDDRPFKESPQGPDDFMPVVAVNREGVVGVMWYDRRDNSDDIGYWIRFTASLDGGETFLPSVRVSEAPTSFVKNDKWGLRAYAYGGGDPRPEAKGGTLKLGVTLGFLPYSGGDTAGMAADASSVFHPFWVDNRTGLPQVWTAPVTVRGNAMPHGSADLAGLEDISAKVYLEFDTPVYDRLVDVVSLTARLKNTSEDVLRGPIKVRVIRHESELGVVEITNADNGKRGNGAVWDFTGSLKDDRLKPGETSQTKMLMLRLSDLRPLRSPRDFRPRLVSLEARVLGKMDRPKRGSSEEEESRKQEDNRE